MSEDLDALFAELSRPFPVEELEWKPGAVTKDKTKALAMVYVQNRAIMARLDSVVRPWNWRVSFHPWRPGEIPIQPPPKRSDGPTPQRMAATLCRLEIRVQGEWIPKEDIADETDLESSKGGASSSMKRAAVQWNIGRELYALDTQWAPYDADRKRIDPNWTPRLSGSPPAARSPSPSPKAAPKAKAQPAPAQAARKPAPPRWDDFRLERIEIAPPYSGMSWAEAWDMDKGLFFEWAKEKYQEISDDIAASGPPRRDPTEEECRVKAAVLHLEPLMRSKPK